VAAAMYYKAINKSRSKKPATKSIADEVAAKIPATGKPQTI
jgi:hypothetical protein